MANRGRLTTEAMLQELGLEDDYDADEPMMPGSDEFSDLEDVEDDDDSDTPPPPPPSDAPTPSSDTPPCWSATLNPVTIPPFTSPVGPKVTIPESPSNTFQLMLMFTPALLDSIVEQSNMYAKEVMGEEKFSSWEKITSEEMKAYLRFFILMGINHLHLPALDDYWSTDPTLHYSPIAGRITRDRFREILRYLHFVDNNTPSAKRVTWTRSAWKGATCVRSSVIAILRPLRSTQRGSR